MDNQQETLSKLQQAWKHYKTDSGSSQAKAAVALGMNQSALSQYLRGEINANTDFLAKFNNLTGSQVEGENKVELKGVSIPLRYRLSGLVPETTKILVQSMVSSADCIGVLVDTVSSFKRGSVLIADPSAEIREGDLVLVVVDRALINSKVRVGNIQTDGDGLSLTVPSWGGSEKVNIGEDCAVLRITSNFYPQQAAKVISL